MLQLTSLVTVIRNIIKEYYACIIIRHIFTFNRKIYPMFIYLIISWYSIIMQKLYCTCGNLFLDINYFSLQSLILRIRYPNMLYEFFVRIIFTNRSRSIIHASDVYFSLNDWLGLKIEMNRFDSFDDSAWSVLLNFSSNQLETKTVL